jgi:hypothetical protein
MTLACRKYHLQGPHPDREWLFIHRIDSRYSRGHIYSPWERLAAAIKLSKT